MGLSQVISTMLCALMIWTVKTH